jgi:hypothetical protein
MIRRATGNPGRADRQRRELNTEGPALDSKNNLYFTSRHVKGIVRWNKAEGAQRHAAVATKGPGGLWIDGSDNII